MRGSEPPRCNNHAGWPAPDVAEATEAGGADDAGPQPLPAGPELATINDVVADLAEKQSRLSAFIDLHLPKLSVASLARLLALHGQNASRLGRLLRDQRALSGEASDGIAGAIAQALDELANELGDDV